MSEPHALAWQRVLRQGALLEPEAPSASEHLHEDSHGAHGGAGDDRHRLLVHPRSDSVNACGEIPRAPPQTVATSQLTPLALSLLQSFSRTAWSRHTALAGGWGQRPLNGVVHLGLGPPSRPAAMLVLAQHTLGIKNSPVACLAPVACCPACSSDSSDPCSDRATHVAQSPKAIPPPSRRRLRGERCWPPYSFSRSPASPTREPDAKSPHLARHEIVR